MNKPYYTLKQSNFFLGNDQISTTKKTHFFFLDLLEKKSPFLFSGFFFFFFKEMENSSAAELYRVASVGLGRNSSSVWRNSGREIFSTSTRDEDDEEALKWAALEKLPTYNRVRKGILTDIGGPAREIDVDKLGFEDKKELLERLVKTAEEDNEKFLLKLRQRIDRYVCVFFWFWFTIHEGVKCYFELIILHFVVANVDMHLHVNLKLCIIFT